MTQRDWQKDMELCDAATPGRWGWYEPTRCIYTARKDRDALDTILYDPAGAGHLQEEDAEFIAEARTALPYWLQEAKEREKREQRLKEAYERTLESIYTQHCTMNHMENTEHEEGQISGLIKASNILKQAFSTLYPDTPAPKEGSS